MPADSVRRTVSRLLATPSCSRPCRSAAVGFATERGLVAAGRTPDPYRAPATPGGQAIAPAANPTACRRYTRRTRASRWATRPAARTAGHRPAHEPLADQFAAVPDGIASLLRRRSSKHAPDPVARPGVAGPDRPQPPAGNAPPAACRRVLPAMSLPGCSPGDASLARSSPLLLFSDIPSILCLQPIDDLPNLQFSLQPLVKKSPLGIY